MKFLNYVCSIMGIAVVLASCGIFINKKSERPLPLGKEMPRPIYTSPFTSKASQARNYAMENQFSAKYCFFIDMSIPSGRKRFFVYDRSEEHTSELQSHSFI